MRCPDSTMSLPADAPLNMEPSFRALAERYRVVFFDAYGVLKNSKGMIEGAGETLAALMDAGIDCYVITNDASRSLEAMAQTYVHPQRGPLLPVDKIISSGMLASEFLSLKFGALEPSVAPGCVAYLGKPESAYFIEAAGLQAVPLAEVSDAQQLLALAFLDDEGFDWNEGLTRAVNMLRRTNLTTLVANPDVSYPAGGGEVGVAVGSLANMVERITRKTFLRFGKPDTQIFSFAYARLLSEYPDISKRDVLMVGDTLHMDILGANQFGIDTALVLSGNTRPDEVSRLVAATSVIPTYICQSIVG